MFKIFFEIFRFFLFCTPLVDFYRWPLLNIAIFSVSDSKRYSKDPTGVANFRPLPQEQTQDVVKKTFKGLGKNVPKLLQTDKYSLEIRNSLFRTKFVEEILTGKLDPDNYLRFKVQNVVYLDHAAKMYSLASNKMQIQGKQEWFEFYRAQSEKHKKLYEQLLTTCGVKDAESVAKGPAVKFYTDYLTVVATDSPEYLAIAMLPCSNYWSLIADYLEKDKRPMNAFKQKWIKENKRTGVGSTETFVANHYKEEDFKPGLFHFCKASVAEVNTFQEAGGESLTEYLDILEACRKVQ